MFAAVQYGNWSGRAYDLALPWAVRFRLARQRLLARSLAVLVSVLSDGSCTSAPQGNDGSTTYASVGRDQRASRPMLFRGFAGDIKLGLVQAGVFRRVFTFGSLAVKVPRLRHLAGGMRSNRWEREMWRIWRPYFGWRTLCPVLFADPAGLVLVMARAQQPVSRIEIESLPDAYPGITAETKSQDYGRYAGRVVAVDYGLWDARDVAERRRYYRQFESENRPHFSGEEQDA